MLAYYVEAVRRAAEEKSRLEGLVGAEARKPRWRRRVDSLRCLKGVDTAPPPGRPKDLAKGQAPDRGARRHAAKGVRRLVERREALLARGVHGNKANVATARELACWVWAVGLMAEEA